VPLEMAFGNGLSEPQTPWLVPALDLTGEMRDEAHGVSKAGSSMML